MLDDALRVFGHHESMPGRLVDRATVRQPEDGVDARRTCGGVSRKVVVPKPESGRVEREVQSFVGFTQRLFGRHCAIDVDDDPEPGISSDSRYAARLRAQEHPPELAVARPQPAANIERAARRDRIGPAVAHELGIVVMDGCEQVERTVRSRRRRSIDPVTAEQMCMPRDVGGEDGVGQRVDHCAEALLAGSQAQFGGGVFVHLPPQPDAVGVRLQAIAARTRGHQRHQCTGTNYQQRDVPHFRQRGTVRTRHYDRSGREHGSERSRQPPGLQRRRPDADQHKQEGQCPPGSRQGELQGQWRRHDEDHGHDAHERPAQVFVQRGPPFAARPSIRLAMKRAARSTAAGGATFSACAAALVMRAHDAARRDDLLLVPAGRPRAHPYGLGEPLGDKPPPR
jgi:hypothetical protein